MLPSRESEKKTYLERKHGSFGFSNVSIATLLSTATAWAGTTSILDSLILWSWNKLLYRCKNVKIFGAEGTIHDAVYDWVNGSAGKSKTSVTHVHLSLELPVCVYKVDHIDYHNRSPTSQKTNNNDQENVGNVNFFDWKSAVSWVITLASPKLEL